VCCLRFLLVTYPPAPSSLFLTHPPLIPLPISSIHYSFSDPPHSSPSPQPIIPSSLSLLDSEYLNPAVLLTPFRPLNSSYSLPSHPLSFATFRAYSPSFLLLLNFPPPPLVTPDPPKPSPFPAPKPRAAYHSLLSAHLNLTRFPFILL